MDTNEFDERNMAKSRAVCEMIEREDVGTRVLLSERERRILDMWPRFEDGEPVMVGDEATSSKNLRFTVKRIELRRGKWMLNDSVMEGHYLDGKREKRVKRPAPKVLDADGVEIKVGDRVYAVDSGREFEVVGFGAPKCDGCESYFVHTRGVDRLGLTGFSKPTELTHTHPDSWKRLEEDALNFVRDNQLPHDLDQMERDVLDIVRRAKALAGVGDA